VVVSLLHTIFEMLAFKNDIGFWSQNKSMEGLSARTVIINACCQVVVFLYILNNETSMLIIGSVGALQSCSCFKVCSSLRKLAVGFCCSAVA
jgi:Cleft lip and palate transmembrane protein 1 (CLPTM1)